MPYSEGLPEVSGNKGTKKNIARILIVAEGVRQIRLTGNK